MAQTYPTNNVKQNFGCQQIARELESWKRTVSDKPEYCFRDILARMASVISGW
jgi:hypothetical protein